MAGGLHQATPRAGGPAKPRASKLRGLLATLQKVQEHRRRPRARVRAHVPPLHFVQAQQGRAKH